MEVVVRWMPSHSPPTSLLTEGKIETRNTETP